MSESKAATEPADVIVIGAGPAGETVAGRCADGGMDVVLVERELVGGECSYWGCIPSKTLIRPGDVLAAAGRVPGAAQAVTGQIDVPAALARRDYMTSNWSDTGQQPWLEQHRIRLVRGAARLEGPRAVVVNAPSTPARRLTARVAVVLATGSEPVLPPVEGLVEARPWDNRSATAAKEIPRRLLVLGGGAVGLELAQAFRRLGSEEVTVVEGAPTLLGREEPFAGEQVQAAFAAEGITVRCSTLVQRVDRDGADGPVTATLPGSEQIVADEILVATGRRPRTGDLGGETVGLTPGRPVAVDDQLRAVEVAGGWLYAIGDCTGLAPLTHMGKYQARIAADVILGKDARDRASQAVVPRVTFTDPQVCAVGLTERDAVQRGFTVRTVEYGTGDVPGSYTQGEGLSGTSKLVVDADRQVLLGATFTGSGVAELLHSATVAIIGQVPLTQLWHAVPSFPTVSEVWLRLLEGYGL